MIDFRSRTVMARVRGVPVYLDGTVNLAPGDGGVMPDIARFSNPFRGPMLIDTIGFKVAAGGMNGITQLSSNPIQLGGSIRCKLRVGGLWMTGDKPVPLWSFGQAAQIALETMNNGIALSGFNSYYQWKLPKRLWVSPGNAIIPAFFRTQARTPASIAIPGDAAQAQLGAAVKVAVTIAYRGLRFPVGTPMPPVIDVPFATAWIDDAGWTIPGMSSERDLVNPFQAPLEVERFTGRIDAVNIAGASSYECDYLGQQCTVKMSGSSGQEIIRTFEQTAGNADNSSGAVPFNVAFDGLRREFMFRGVLAPKERYNAAVYQKNAGDLGTNFTSVTPMITLIGSRKERIS